MADITIVEVGPRDGLQNEKRIVPTIDKLRLIELLTDAGLSRIEVTAFVSPRWVPQMADHEKVLRNVPQTPRVSRSVLVPNEQGAACALGIGVEEVVIFTSASETFAQKNINCSIAESIERFSPVAALARKYGARLRGYVSCSTECPFEGLVEPQATTQVVAALNALGCAEVSLADTIGLASPDQVDAMLESVTAHFSSEMLACHFHDTSGQALNNVDVSLDYGIRVFDSSAGGLGGCPYAPGAAGNLKTSSLVRHLHGKGYSTGISLVALERAEEFAQSLCSELV